jgi:enoyl-CoA hydratase/carnithine racemase
VRVVVLTGAGENFCRGPADDLDPLTVGVDPAASLSRIRVPVIAHVRGACASVGFDLALACDVRVGDAGATFTMADIGMGRLPCWGGTQRLPRAVGPAWATRLILLGETMTATQAEGAGFIYRLGGTDAVNDLVDRLLTLSPLALEYAKEAVHRGAELPLRDGLRLEGDLNTLLQASADRVAGLDAFFAKRAADFAGR